MNATQRHVTLEVYDVTLKNIFISTGLEINYIYKVRQLRQCKRFTTDEWTINFNCQLHNCFDTYISNAQNINRYRVVNIEYHGGK